MQTVAPSPLPVRIDVVYVEKSLMSFTYFLYQQIMLTINTLEIPAVVTQKKIMIFRAKQWI